MAPDEFSPAVLAAQNREEISLPSPEQLPTGHKPSQTTPFLRGPVPMDWLECAFLAAGGSGLMLGIKLWWISGMNRGARTFRVNITRLKAGQALPTKRRGLKLLEEAGLIRRIWRPGRRLEVELLDPSAPGPV